MKIVKIDMTKLGVAIRNEADIIRKGGIVVYPTETCYALGANALDCASVKKVFLIKGRSPTNPIPIIVDNIARAKDLAFFNKQAMKLAETFWPGPLTIAVRKKNIIPNILNPDRIAIRVPNHAVSMALVKSASIPITATSANRSGDPSPYSIDEVKKSLPPSIDLILDLGRLPYCPPSTIVDFVLKPSPQITRQGPISIGSILEVLRIKRNKWWQHTLYLTSRLSEGTHNLNSDFADSSSLPDAKIKKNCLVAEN